MSESNYTPAPWKVEVNDLRGGKYWTIHRATHLEPIDIHEDDNGEADAPLIAAAPDLLEALKGILAITDRDHVVWKRARAAIAIAEATELDKEN